MWKVQPVKFGLLHISFLVLTVIGRALAVFFGYQFQGEDKKKKRDLILSVTGLLLVGLEIVKIINCFCIHQADLSLIPLQLCSTALFVLPFPYFLEEGKIKDCIYGYLAFIRTTAGICYFVNPTTLFNQRNIFGSLHSGIYHVLIISSGTFLFFSAERYKKDGIFYYLKAFPLFIFFSIVAVGGNFIALRFNPETKLDLFFLRPKGPATIPVLDTMIKPRVPFIAYYFIYLGCFFVVDFVPDVVYSGVNQVVRKIKESRLDSYREKTNG